MAVTVPRDATWVRFPRMVGDAVMHLPILRLLREAGVGPLVVWGPAATVGLVAATAFADAVVPDLGRPGPLELAGILRRHHAARSIHFPKSLRPVLAAFLARVPERIGVGEHLAGLLNTHSAPFWKARGTFLDRYLAILRLRWPGLGPLPFADYDPGVRVAAPAGPYICLMPGSLWPSKAWPHYPAVTRLARAQGFQVAVLGAPAEAALCAGAAAPGGMDLCGRTTLKEAAAWLRGAAGALGNDSGLAHLAAACGTPLVALYGPTDPSGPVIWGPRVGVLRRPGVPCAPCYRRECPVPGHPCLADLDPAAAWQTLRELLILPG